MRSPWASERFSIRARSCCWPAGRRSERPSSACTRASRLLTFQPRRCGRIRTSVSSSTRLRHKPPATRYPPPIGFATEWTGHAQDQDHWRDTGLRVVGPAVNRLQGAFCENWIEETGEIPAGERYFPHLSPSGPTQAHIAYTSANGSVSSVQVLYYLAINAARREIIIQNPYMLPDTDASQARADAVAPGA